MSVKVKDFAYVSGKKYDGMMGRCYRTTDSAYKNYGERGIRVCAEWIRNIESFRGWLRTHLQSIGVSEGEFVESSGMFQLDRIDVNGHYSPLNCRLVNRQANSRNRRCSTVKEYVSSEGIIIRV